ncbi:MAG: hypothetical protein EHM87_12225 [Burkholderiales bacterium]|nr:MAG: hypothetical protein EHM87_12225 [Burkholderiales bacterium]
MPLAARTAAVRALPSAAESTAEASSETASAAARPAAPAAASAPVAAPWFEVWEVDEPPQFLVAPDDLDDLARRVAHTVRARVSLRIGSDGRLADVEVQTDGIGLQTDDTGSAPGRALQQALRAAFEGLVFLPGRRDGRPVPVVQRWQLAIDPHVPVMLGLRPLD